MIVKIWAFLEVFITWDCKCKLNELLDELAKRGVFSYHLGIVLLKALQTMSFRILKTSKHFILTNTI